MLIHLHSQATTTPKIRAEIQASDEPAWVLAERFGTTEQTVWKWRKRDSVHDRSHTHCASEPYSQTMARSSPTVSLACASARKAGNMSSTSSAPNWTSNTA